MNEISERDLVLHYYGESEDAEKIVASLESSPELRRQFDDLSALLDAVEEPEIPALSPSYGATTWAKIRHRIEVPKERAGWLFPLPRWAWATTAAMALVAAFLTGRFFPAESPEVFAAADRERILLASVADHLDQSQLLLLEIANDEEGSFDLQREGPRASELVSRNRLYRQSAAGGDRDVVTDLLDELERFLVELSHLPADSDLEILRERLQDRDLLFRVRVLGTSLRDAAQWPKSRSTEGKSV